MGGHRREDTALGVSWFRPSPRKIARNEIVTTDELTVAARVAIVVVARAVHRYLSGGCPVLLSSALVIRRIPRRFWIVQACGPRPTLPKGGCFHQLNYW